MRDSTAELQIMLCWFLPVTGLKGIKLRLLVSDLATGFFLTPFWYGQRCPPRGTLPRSPRLTLQHSVQDWVRRSCVCRGPSWEGRCCALFTFACLAYVSTRRGNYTRHELLL